MDTQTVTQANTLESFIKLNVSGKIFEMIFGADRDLLLNFIYDKSIDNDFNALDFLDQFKSKSSKELTLRNHKMAQDIAIQRIAHTEPTSGDVLIDDLDNKFYLSRIYDDHFQYARDGSYWIGNSGYGSFSGGYAFNGVRNGIEIGSFKSYDLEEVKDQNDSRVFWFFMDERSGAHRGIYFNCNVKTWKFKQK